MTENINLAVQNNLGNNLRLFLGRNQGVRVGESAVVSRRVHQVHPRDLRRILVCIEQDAGKTFCGYTEMEQVVHIDIYHDPANLQAQGVARKIWAAIDNFLEVQGREIIVRKAEDRLTQSGQVAARIFLATAENQGSVTQLLRQGFDRSKEVPENLNDHVHLHVELPEEWYALVYSLIDAVEQSIMEQGYGIRKISRVENGYGKRNYQELNNLMIPFFGKRKPGNTIINQLNQKQIIIELARRLGSIEDVEEFLASMRGNIFQRMAPRSIKKRNPDLDQLAEQMMGLGLVRKALLGYFLTEEGKDLQEHLNLNRRELEAELRKLLRRLPGKNRRYQRTVGSQMACREQEVLNRHKILTRDSKNASNAIAVPETILQGVVRSFCEAKSQITIDKKDIRVYGKKSFIPMDVCLLVDCSASMVGEKSRAAWQLAEYLLLILRERVAVVAFQEMDARVVVPYTRNHRKLMAGLRSVIPAGMTPLASGLMKSLEMIKEERVRNPLLILITDGIPTYPLWSYDSKQDALKAAKEIAQAKVHLTCIGVRSNREFLQELAQAGQGTLYVVDDLNRDTLVQVVHEERAILRKAL